MGQRSTHLLRKVSLYRGIARCARPGAPPTALLGNSHPTTGGRLAGRPGLGADPRSCRETQCPLDRELRMLTCRGEHAESLRPMRSQWTAACSPSPLTSPRRLLPLPASAKPPRLRIQRLPDRRAGSIGPNWHRAHSKPRHPLRRLQRRAPASVVRFDPRSLFMAQFDMRQDLYHGCLVL
jgi:hypothetical protein